jgi:UPF0755 protein
MSRERGRGGGAFSALWTLMSLLFMGVLVAFAGALLAMTEINRDGPNEQEVVFNVPAGAGAIQVAALLEKQGLIRNPLAFRAAAMLYSRDRPLQAGEYAIARGASPREIVQMLASGDALLHEVTIPEGWTTAMAMERIAAAEFLSGDMPETPPEGSILPDTYHVPRGMTRAALASQMRDAQSAFLAQAWEGRAQDLPVRTPEEAVILASIVEKETGIASERAEIAGVFTNRLRQGMRLESDPTIIYGICQCNRLRDAQGQPRGIRRSELDGRTAYNTYQIDGLPPGPIANPGRDAIMAVLNPPQTNNLFFVALVPGDPSQGHVFSPTYAEHNAAVQRYRALEAEAGG